MREEKNTGKYNRTDGFVSFGRLINNQTLKNKYEKKICIIGNGCHLQYYCC
jgi:hypothetical protein